MFECYLFSQLACTTVYRTPSENTVCTASLISRKRAVFPVPTVPQSPAWCRYRKSEWLHLFLFFLPYQKVVLWRVLFCFSFLLNSSWSHYFLVALLSLKADCPVLPPLPIYLGRGCTVGACVGEAAHCWSYLLCSICSPTAFLFFDCAYRWLNGVLVPQNGTRYYFPFSVRGI